MAAGEGRRLRPLTERYAKPVLPIDGRPVVVHLMHELLAAGIRNVAVVVGHLGSQVERLLDGFPLALRFVEQPEPLGSADAIRRAAASPPYLAVAADTVFGSGDLARFLAAAGDVGAIAWRPDPRASRSRLGIVGERVVRVVDDDPDNPYASAPLWLVGPAVHERLASLPGPPFELANAFQAAIDAGTTIRGVEIGPARDLTDPLDLIELNFPYLRAM